MRLNIRTLVHERRLGKLTGAVAVAALVVGGGFGLALGLFGERRAGPAEVALASVGGAQIQAPAPEHPGAHEGMAEREKMPPAQAHEGAAGGEGEIAYYTCPMHNSVRAAEPGNCPICGMTLVPVTRQELDTGQVRIDARRRQLIGVKTGVVERRALTKTIRAVGRVEYDERRYADVTLKFGGWIGDVDADYTGRPVRRGERLFTVYSPELLAAQQEFLEAMKTVTVVKASADGGGRGSELLRATRERLRLLDVAEGEIERLAAEGRAEPYVPMFAQVSGVVIHKDVVRGTFVEAGQQLYRVADLSIVWVLADLYEYELPLVKLGQEATITLSYLPDKTFRGRVSYIYPYLDASTRTVKVRIEVPNPDLVLKPDMYANVVLDIPLGEQLAVSEDAVIYAGPRRLVFLDLGDGRLEPRDVHVGTKVDDWYEVLHGLDEGDRVVTSGNFLIAAESRIKSAAKAFGGAGHAGH